MPSGDRLEVGRGGFEANWWTGREPGGTCHSWEARLLSRSVLINFVWRCFSLLFWGGALGALLAGGLGLSAFVAPDFWWTDNMSFFLWQFLFAGFAGVLLALGGLLKRHRFPLLYKVTVGLSVVAFVSLAVLFVGRASQNTVEFADPEPGAKTLKVVSINLEGLFLGDPVLEDYLKALNADVIVLQEAIWWLQERRWNRLNLPVGGAGENGFPEHYQVGRLGSVVVYSRPPILEASSEIVEGVLHPGARIYHDADREILSLKLQSSGGAVDLLAVHSDSPRTSERWDNKRAYFDQVDASLASKQAVSSSPVLVVGDWNSSPWSARFQRTLDVHDLVTAYPEGWPQPTRYFFDYRLRWLLGAPVDHFAVSPDIGVLDVSLGPDIGSDHRPLEVTLQLPAGVSDGS